MTVLLSRSSLFKTRLLSLLALVVYLLALGPVAAQTSKTSQRVFPGEYLVTLSVSARDLRVTRAMKAHGIGEMRRIARGIFQVETAKSARRQGRSERRSSVPLDPYDTFCKGLLASGAIAGCSPNYEVRVDATTPNDPLFSSLWGLGDGAGLSAQRAWNISTGSSDVVVAVIDTGVDYNHPDLRDNMWSNPGEVPNNGIDDDANGYVDDVYGINAMYGAARPGDPMDENGHGTHVAGTIGAVGHNGLGVVGVNQNVRIMALRFLGASGSGSLAGAITAIDYMITLKNRGVDVRVANNSWGGSGYAPALAEAIQRAEEAGIVFVAAAGNDGADNDVEPSYPANFEMSNVVSVAALDEWGNLASFSNYGATTVDIAAPGVGIYSTFPGNRYVKLSGTSMATPHVAGALALLFAAEPTLNYEQALSRLYEGGRERSALFDGGRRVALVRTQRSVDAGRMLFKEITPLPRGTGVEPACVYDLTASNLVSGADVDTSADDQPIVQRADEGDFYRLDLPFPLPFYDTTLSSVYVSPNGVVYATPPSGIDFEPGRQAPIRSIAALHIDMAPLSPRQGIRVFKGGDRVTIVWQAGLFAAQRSNGEVTVRLTLHATGTAHVSVSFDEGADGSSLRRLALGDPFMLPEAKPGAVIGVTGSSTASSSTLDIASALKGLVASLDQQLVLGVSMTPRCQGGVKPSVRSIALMQSGSPGLSQALNVRGELVGDGSGDVPLSLALDAFRCEGFKMVPLLDGRAGFRVQIPRGPARVAASSGVARDSVRLSSKRPRGYVARDRRVSARMCRAMFRSLRIIPKEARHNPK